jgi:hypothetical protein
MVASEECRWGLCELGSRRHFVLGRTGRCRASGDQIEPRCSAGYPRPPGSNRSDGAVGQVDRLIRQAV